MLCFLQVWEETETLLPESDAISAGWAREGALPARRLCGDWGAKLKLLRYQSRTNALRLRFRADHSRHYAGFKAKVTVADCEYIACSSFGGLVIWLLGSQAEDLGFKNRLALLSFLKFTCKITFNEINVYVTE